MPSFGTYGGSGATGQFHGHGATPCTTSVRFFRLYFGLHDNTKESDLMMRLQKADSKEAIKYLQDYEKYGNTPNAHHYNAAISACVKDGELDEARKVIIQMQKNKVPPNKYTCDYLIDTFALPMNELKRYRTVTKLLRDIMEDMRRP